MNLVEVLRVNLLLLKIAGLWPVKSYSCDFYTIYAIFCTVFFVIGHNLAQTSKVFFIYKELTTLTASLVIMLCEVTAMLKFLLFFVKRTVAIELMAILQGDTFQPKNAKQVDILKNFTSVWYKFYAVYFSSSVMTLGLWSLYPVISKSTSEGKLPFLAWYPYDYTVSPVYEITYVHQVISNFFIAFTNINIDTLGAALLMFISGQCEILCDNLKIMGQDGGDISQEFRRCLIHHKEILNFADKSQQLLSTIAFVQFASTVISICVTMFQLSLVKPLTPEFFTLFCCLSALFTQVFVYCWFGSEVIMRSSDIPTAAFHSNWIEAPIGIKKDLIFFIKRSQKIIEIKAVNFFALSLATFMSILRTSWSYFALLRRVNEE